MKKTTGIIVGIIVTQIALACENKRSENTVQTCQAYTVFGYHCDEATECTKTVWDHDIFCVDDPNTDCVVDIEGSGNETGTIIAHGVKYSGSCGLGSLGQPEGGKCRCRHLDATGDNVVTDPATQRLTIPCIEA